MLELPRYTPAQVTAVLDAYRHLLAAADDETRAYLGLDRRRAWGILTSDFRALTPEALHKFHDSWERIVSSTVDPAVLARALRELAAGSIGYSLGMSPWADDLLLRTVRPTTRRLIAVVAHDWYPIMKGTIVDRLRDIEARSPLIRFPAIGHPDRQWKKYERAFPSRALDHPDCALLFANLVPDFRPPGAPVEGPFPFERGFSYAACASGLRSLLSSIERAGIEIAGIVTWGAPVWEHLRPLEDATWRRLGVMEAAARAAREGDLSFAMGGGRTIPWFPVAHPARSGNFLQPAHLAAHDLAWQRILGT